MMESKNYSKNYISIFELDYEKEELIKYVCALSNKVPVYGSEETKIRFVSKEELKDVLKDLKQKGKLVELKKTLESLRRDYWKEFESELYRLVPIPMRFQYPYWVKLVEIALRGESSVSAVIRRILLEKIEDIVRYMESSGTYNPEAINLLKKRLEDTKKGIKERGRSSYFTLFEEFLPEEEIRENIKPSDTSRARIADEIVEEIRSFAKLALKKKMLANGISEKLFELLLEYMVFEPWFDAELRVENEELVIHVVALPPFVPRSYSRKDSDEVDYDEFALLFPLAALQKHSPEEIKRLAEVTGTPAFKGLSEEEINTLKNILLQSDKVLDISKLLGVSNENIEIKILKEVYKNLGYFDPVSNSKDLIFDNIEGWLKFAGWELLSVRIPIIVKDDAVYVKDTNVEVDDPIALGSYIAQEYKSRFDLDEKSASIDFEDIDDEEIDKLVESVENELAIKGVEKLSLLFSTKIADVIRTSEVFTTTMPHGFVPILKLFTGKSPKEIVVDYLRGVNL